MRLLLFLIVASWGMLFGLFSLAEDALGAPITVSHEADADFNFDEREFPLPSVPGILRNGDFTMSQGTGTSRSMVVGDAEDDPTVWNHTLVFPSFPVELLSVLLYIEVVHGGDEPANDTLEWRGLGRTGIGGDPNAGDEEDYVFDFLGVFGQSAVLSAIFGAGGTGGGGPITTTSSFEWVDDAFVQHSTLVVTYEDAPEPSTNTLLASGALLLLYFWSRTLKAKL